MNASQDRSGRRVPHQSAPAEDADGVDFAESEKQDLEKSEASVTGIRYLGKFLRGVYGF